LVASPDRAATGIAGLDDILDGRKAISVVKKRSGKHENAIRELLFTPTGVTVGEPLTNFVGVLTGVPRFVGATKDLGD
jgi:circadian clock protein KaiC